MNEERWQRLTDILQLAWAMNAGERLEFLSQIGAEDPAVRSNVEALLASDQNIGDFLEVPAIYLAGNLEAGDLGDQWSARRVGPYRTLREIGHGGMGT